MPLPSAASNININNRILRTDSYKLGHPNQLPPKSEQIYSYSESRQTHTDLVMFGMHPVMQKVFDTPVTVDDLDQAKEVCKAHLGKELVAAADWEYIIKEYGGFLPIDVYGLPEGTVVPGSVPMLSLFSKDKRLAWLTNNLETELGHIWYGITIATNSHECKKILTKYLIETGCDPQLADFMLVDFGARGVTCMEQAIMGGMAHLLSFKATDNLPAIMGCIKYYDGGMCGFSIPATEHSTITSWGREHEADAYENFLDKNPTGPIACVSDSYDIFNAVENIWGGKLRNKIMARDGKLIIRPDSGDPVEVNRRILHILRDKFGGSTNAKSFTILDPHVGIIQGDGIDKEMMTKVLEMEKTEGFAASNIAFGSGGGLLQKFNRDSLRFAIKCSAVVVDGHSRDVSKDPITDSGKKSKQGFVYAGGSCAEGYRALSHYDPEQIITCLDSAFVPYVIDGKVVRRESFDTIRQRLIAHTKI